MRKNEALLPVSLGVRPGVSAFIPDVLMGSTRKLPSHGILTEVWNMRAPCLAPLPAPRLSGAPTLTYALDHVGLLADTCINVTQHLVQEGETLPTLYSPAMLWAWFALASLKGECWHVFRWVCCACVCTVLPSYPRNNISSLHSSPAQCFPGVFVGGKIPAWPCGHSNGFFTYTYK